MLEETSKCIILYQRNLWALHNHDIFPTKFIDFNNILLSICLRIFQQQVKILQQNYCFFALKYLN